MLVALLPNFSVIWSHISEDIQYFFDELATSGHYLGKFSDIGTQYVMAQII